MLPKAVSDTVFHAESRILRACFDKYHTMTTTMQQRIQMQTLNAVHVLVPRQLTPHYQIGWLLMSAPLWS